MYTNGIYLTVSKKKHAYVRSGEKKSGKICQGLLVAVSLLSFSSVGPHVND